VGIQRWNRYHITPAPRVAASRVMVSAIARSLARFFHEKKSGDAQLIDAFPAVGPSCGTGKVAHRSPPIPCRAAGFS
jgi:hypothetical protein